MAAASSSTVCDAASAARVRYVSAHRVNLRDKPSISAAIIGRLKIGSAVTLVGREEDWCAVSVEEPGAAAPRTGYMACQWLADVPPRIEALDNERLQRDLAGAARRELLPLDERAFWLSPSLERWMSFARDQQVLGIRDGVVAPDASPGGPRISPAESFSESVALIGAGLVVRSLVQAAPLAATDPDIVTVLRAAPLPDAKSSWFKQGDIDAVLPSGVAERDANVGTAHDESLILWHSAVAPLDALSHRANARMTVKIVEAWHAGHEGTLLGVGGAGALLVDYEPAAAFNVVQAGGRIESIPVEEVRYHLAVEACDFESATLLKPGREKSRSDVRDALVSWIGTRPVGSQARMSSRDSELRLSDQRYRLVVTKVDIDGDGQPDFLVHEWTNATPYGGRVVHANVAGAWRMLFVVQVSECDD